MLCGEATHTNFVVFGLTRSGLEPTIYYTRAEHANHYNTDAVNLHQKDQQVTEREQLHNLLKYMAITH